ncbi:hypothetical protein NKH41_03280 [Mesorhizobium sp. M1169]|uniref:hypothetical protein n=1 Tax=unclassified Mesorhizobium TaxID=325217 RepID=UPI0033372A47
MINDNENAAQARISLGRDINTLEPQTRMAWADAAAIPDEEVESAPAEEHSPAQVEYLKNLGNPSIADLTEEQREMLDFFGRLRKPADTEEPPDEAAKPLPQAPVIIGPHSTFDLEKIAQLLPGRRSELADYIALVRRGSKDNASLSDQWSLEQARQHLAPYVIK